MSIKPLTRNPVGTPMAISLRSTRELPTGNWRTFRPQYVTRSSPCNLDCPAGTDVRAFVEQAADGDFEGAWRTIRRHNPLPAVCGRVCYHPCELNCSRRDLDEPIAIHAIERSIADEARRRQLRPEVPALLDSPRRIGVVGSGPAGLSCAYHLVRRGYLVTVFDDQPEPGGMLRYGIPSYRLPRTALDHELGLLAGMGVTFVTHARVGAVSGAPDLSAYAAVFLGIGAQRSRQGLVPGETLPGVSSGLALLRQVNGGERPSLDGPVVVVGGGNTAIDAARVALRLGGEPTVVYRRGREDMPAHPDEVAQAEAEGIRFEFHAVPARFIDGHGRVSAVELQRMRPGEPDASGRRRPEAIPGATYTVPASRVLTAIGEEVEVDLLESFAGVSNGRIRADRWGRTGAPSVFAGGDAATGAGTVVEAIGSGRRAAEAIDAHLSGRCVVDEGLAERVGPGDMNLFYFQRHRRAHPRVRDTFSSTHSFDEVVSRLPWDRAVAEAQRCFTCGSCTTCDNCYVFCPDAAITPNRGAGTYTVDYGHCKGCGICATECPRGAITFTAEEPK